MRPPSPNIPVIATGGVWTSSSRPHLNEANETAGPPGTNVCNHKSWTVWVYVLAQPDTLQSWIQVNTRLWSLVCKPSETKSPTLRFLQGATTSFSEESRLLIQISTNLSVTTWNCCWPNQRHIWGSWAEIKSEEKEEEEGDELKN